MYERIFWPVDPLNPAQLPVPLLKILNGSGARLRIVSVLEPLTIPDLLPGRIDDPHTMQLLRVRNTDLRQTLRDMSRPAAALGMEVETAVIEGSPLETLLTEIRTSGSDLLLIRTRATGENGKRIGGLTYDLLLRSPVPVCCVRKIPPDLTLRKVVVATDFSEKAYAALQAAMELARRHKAVLALLHIVPTHGLELPPATRQRLHDGARSALERWRGARADFAAAGLEIEEVVADAPEPAEGIVAEVQRLAGDLLVIAAQGWTGIPGVFFGSTARRVVRYSEKPVLVTRA
jgi:nucleotide-binding universal stress UspA family protein